MAPAAGRLAERPATRDRASRLERAQHRGEHRRSSRVSRGGRRTPLPGICAGPRFGPSPSAQSRRDPSPRRSRRCRQTSCPLIFGNPMSSSTTSGRYFSAASIAPKASCTASVFAIVERVAAQQRTLTPECSELRRSARESVSVWPDMPATCRSTHASRRARRPARVSFARRTRPRQVRRLHDRKDASRQRGAPRRCARVAAARRWPHGWAELTLFRPVGEWAAQVAALKTPDGDVFAEAG